MHTVLIWSILKYMHIIHLILYMYYLKCITNFFVMLSHWTNWQTFVIYV